MINWFDMPDEGLSNGGLFEVKELEVTENGTYETKGEMYNKVVVNVEGGGGGSSDFSTANVVVDWSLLGFNELFFDCCPSIVENFYTNDDTEMIIGMAYSETSPATIKVPLFDGGCFWEHSTTAVWEVTGDIEIIDEKGFMITGDGTITCVSDPIF